MLMGWYSDLNGSDEYEAVMVVQGRERRVIYLQRPVSTTILMPSIVTPVSAKLVEKTIFLVPGAARSNTYANIVLKRVGKGGAGGRFKPRDAVNREGSLLLCVSDGHIPTAAPRGTAGHTSTSAAL